MGMQIRAIFNLCRNSGSGLPAPDRHRRRTGKQQEGGGVGDYAVRSVLSIVMAEVSSGYGPYDR